MNYSTAVMLINQNIRAIKTIYEPDTNTHKQTRTTFKTLDNSIAVGDYVVVPTDTRHGKTVVLVTEVDVDVDFESSVVVEWVIDKISTEQNQKILDEEVKWIEALKASEKRRKREEIKKSMLEMYQDDGIEKLPIANMQSPAAIEQVKE